MSLGEVIESIQKEAFSRCMNPPEPPEGNSVITYDGKNQKWISCPYCGKKLMPLTPGAHIIGQVMRCKNSTCKKDFMVNI